MDVIDKVQIDLTDLLNMKAANQDANEQLEQLYIQANILEEKIKKFADEPPRRPSKEHKEIKSELHCVNKEIKKTIRAINKCNALKDAAAKIGTRHGKITLNKTKYYW